MSGQNGGGSTGRFQPSGQGDLAPRGERAKARANLEALEVLRGLDGRPATPEEQATLARWSGWGSLPGIFDEGDVAWAPERIRLRALVGDQGFAMAKKTVLNAHYSDAMVVKAIWEAVTALSFPGGRVLEPGCGSGNFIGLAPLAIRSRFTGVEIDPSTAAIAQALYPDAEIRCEGFESTRLQEGSFDLAIGNVPFGAYSLYDPVHNRAKLSIHNHFIVKALRLVRPGGLVAVITSRFTLDARSPAARRAMEELADFLGAVRLPRGAMRAAAGTDAVMDVVLLRRREPAAAPRGAAWEHTAEVDLPGGRARMSEFFAARPEMILGRAEVAHGQYSEVDLNVVPTGELAPALSEALRTLVGEARDAGLTWIPGECATDEIPPEVVSGRGPAKEGSLLVAGAGFARVQGGRHVRFHCVPFHDTVELGALIGLRERAIGLLDLEAGGAPDEECDAARSALGAAYDRYVSRFGPLNRSRLVRGKGIDSETGEPLYRRLRPQMGGFACDPDYRTVMALEIFDPDTQTAEKAPIFSRRSIVPREPARGAETAADALAICLDERGEPDLARIAHLLGADPQEAREELGDLVYEDPATGGLVVAARYLSGNVRAKLALAREAAAEDLSWAPNVAALEAVMPPDLAPEEIDASPGAPWIPPSDIEDFMRDVLSCASPQVERVAVDSSWTVRASTADRRSVAATSTFGTVRANGVDLLSAALNQSPVTVYDELDDGRRIPNREETLAALERQDLLKDRFREWVWEQPSRRARLAEVYNRTYNCYVKPRYDGSHLSFPGLAEHFTPRQHQRDAAYQMLCEPGVGLFHDVGAGKTATTVLGAMELKRLGRIKLPAFVVPNHMIEQFAAEFLRLYPAARLLVLGRDEANSDGRKSFVARCAMGSWDAVILSHSSFGLIPVSPTIQFDYIEEQLSRYEADIEVSSGGRGISVKRLEKKVMGLQGKLRELLQQERKDDGLTFDRSGIDYLVIDEAHLFKNLAFATRIQAAGGGGSKRAADLDMKLWVIRERGGRAVATFATATPIANSLCEAWVMQHYLQPELLASIGLDSFDAWAANYGRTVTLLELAPDGGSYRINTRFARFTNVPELLGTWNLMANVKSTAELGLAVPTIAGGAPVTHVVPPTPALTAFVRLLVARAKAVKERSVLPEEDNMLTVVGDGRKAALDLRTIDWDRLWERMDHHPRDAKQCLVAAEEAAQGFDPDLGKIATMALQAASIYHATSDREYRDAWDRPSPRRGALQVVFCDLSTPKSNGTWNGYDELKSRLVALGVPAVRVRYVQEAEGDTGRADLFADCREGRVSVLVGSTPTMGIGTNVQARLVALHHLDAPWRPADIAQRDGRGIRQGNQHSEVGVHRYVTEGSFDVYMWQLLELKAAFIWQVMSGQVTERSVEDVGDVALDYAQVKALATGNPLIMEKAGVDNDVAKLSRAKKQHARDQSTLRHLLASNELRVQTLEERVTDTHAAIERRQDTTGERFSMVVAGETFTGRSEAGTALRAFPAEMLKDAPDRWHPYREAGALAGFRVHVRTDRAPGAYAVSSVWMKVEGTEIELWMPASEWAASDGLHIVQRLEMKIRTLESTLDEDMERLERARADVEEARARIGRPFDGELRLRRLLERQREIDTELARMEEGAGGGRSPAAGVR